MILCNIKIQEAMFAARNSHRERLSAARPYSLKHARFVLGQTMETVRLPILPALETCLAARIEGKSSRARCGLLVHFTAPTIHPGYEGTITLEMINLGEPDFLLFPGMTIAQLIIEEVKGIPFQKDSQFQGQTTPEGLKG
jgi:dCTP deaminase